MRTAAVFAVAAFGRSGRRDWARLLVMAARGTGGHRLTSTQRCRRSTVTCDVPSKRVLHLAVARYSGPTLLLARSLRHRSSRGRVVSAVTSSVVGGVTSSVRVAQAACRRGGRWLLLGAGAVSVRAPVAVASRGGCRCCTRGCPSWGRGQPWRVMRQRRCIRSRLPLPLACRCRRGRPVPAHTLTRRASGARDNLLEACPVLALRSGAGTTDAIASRLPQLARASDVRQCSGPSCC